MKTKNERKKKKKKVQENPRGLKSTEILPKIQSMTMTFLVI